MALKDVETLDDIVKALYESISFSGPEGPDLDRLRFLFAPGARLLNMEDGGREVMDVDTFIQKFREEIDLGNISWFQEREISRKTEAFGAIVHAFSTCEARFSEEPGSPVIRGINSIQFYKSQGRWWVYSILWDNENETQPIPLRYLP